MSRASPNHVHKDHHRWEQDHALWADEAARWVEEAGELLEDLAAIQAAVRAQREELDVHLARIEGHRIHDLHHERVMAAADPDPGELARLADQHEATGAAHEEMRAVQDRLRHRHYHVLWAVRGLRQVLEREPGVTPRR